MTKENYKMKCRYCGINDAENETVFCNKCRESRPNYLTLQQFIQVLKTIRLQIAEGIPIGLDDSNDIGYKHTYCAWGICTNSIHVWHDPLMHIWPMDFIENRKVAPLHIPKGYKCPLDSREPNYQSGCFYKCLAFNKHEKLSRKKALQLYDNVIMKVEKAIND
jgi:hypothetical protein